VRHEWPIVETEPKTRQGIFDRVVRHYRAQPRRCPDHGMGFYRFDGDRCPVGALIDDADYRSDMEAYTVRDLLKKFALPQWFHDNISFIEELQNLHDNEANWVNGRMDTALEQFADDHGLTMRCPIRT
jgi:hypothetical protein